MAISSLTLNSSSLRHPILSFYKEAIKIAQLAGDFSLTSGSNQLTQWLACKNLSVSAGATLQMPASGELSFIFVDVLTLNGTILSAYNATYSAFGATSGAGAGNILIFARQIVGSGTIFASGTSSVAPTSNATSTSLSGGNGANGQYLLSTSITMNGTGGFDNNGGGGIGGTKGVISTATNFSFSFLHWLFNVTEGFKIISGSGGTGSSSASGQSKYNVGGGGGASIVAAGGNTGGYTYNSSGTGGSGGGGGGYIFIMTESSLPAITITANGGNGSNSYNSGGGGGGGGGGLVSIIAPSTNATISVAGGNGGVGSSGTGSAGATGLSVYLKDNLSN